MWKPSFTYCSKYNFFIAPFRLKQNLRPRYIHPLKKYYTDYCTHSTYAKEAYNTYDDKLSKGVNTFTYRTHSCGELSIKNVGQKVTLCGWVQYVRLSKFLLIRDPYGLTQCMVKNVDLDVATLPLETVIKIQGTVVARPKDMVNRDMATGDIEVTIDKLDILNKVGLQPFNLRSYQKPKEQLRLQHRYIDLRFPEMQYNLRQRSRMLHEMRKFLVDEHNFTEVETPTLFCRTPGGAREFVVPTHHPGLFYSLVQSPQQFKQMLMAGAVDRYFQIARCYRDESTRADRQPEFTQLDIELSFSNHNHILTLIELLLYKTFIRDLPKPPFPRITYKQALEKYGSDKPNLCHNLELINITPVFKDNVDKEFGAFTLPYCSKLGKLSTKYRDKSRELAKKYNVKIVQFENISKDIGSIVYDKIKSIIGPDNSCLLAMGDKDSVCLSLGEFREILANLLKSKELITFHNSMKPLWVVDFPLFVQGEKGMEPCHHPFTAPHPEDLHLLDTDPLNVKSLAYDLVLNGNEVGGGSVRIHNANLQEKILSLLNICPDNLTHFMNALKSGCPPHAGIALGIDRLMAIACGAESIRDVIAFPKSHEGTDPMSGAPNKISDEDKKYYGLK